ncbi:MAG: BirA family transcriptional regulator [Actinomycetota bacterium]|nr:BirA family transcriptional regulator [Actinomycetota bacterium]
MLDTGARATLATTRFGDVTWVAEVVSTNDEVAARARAGAPEGVVVVADRQAAGRGRRGRTWEAPADSSLLVSVWLRPPAPHPAVIAAGLAAADACRSTTGVAPSLKWPNDLVVDDRGKLAGILAEAVGDGVVVGLGLNVDWGDTPLPPGATSLAQVTGTGVDRSRLLVAYLVALEARCRQSPGALLAAYRAACSTIGRRVRVELPGGGSFEGRADGVDDDGRLVVDGRSVAAGDVVHVRPAS